MQGGGYFRIAVVLLLDCYDFVCFFLFTIGFIVVHSVLF